MCVRVCMPVSPTDFVTFESIRLFSLHFKSVSQTMDFFFFFAACITVNGYLKTILIIDLNVYILGEILLCVDELLRNYSLRKAFM